MGGHAWPHRDPDDGGAGGDGRRGKALTVHSHHVSGLPVS